MLHMHMAQINKEPIQEVDEQELERMLEAIYEEEAPVHTIE